VAYQNAGQVTVIEQKEFDGRNGTVTLYSFQIEGSRRWFRTGRVNPSFNEGDYVAFENDDKGNVDLDTVQVGDDAAPPRQQPRGQSGPRRSSGGGGGPDRSRQRPSGGASSGSGQTRDGYWAEKEARDIAREERYQAVDVPRMSFSAAQDRAVQLVTGLVQAGALPLGTKKGDAYDLVMGFVDQTANRFFLDSMGAHERLKALEEEALEASPAEDEEAYDDDYDG
jgi:hypothetical protein